MINRIAFFNRTKTHLLFTKLLNGQVQGMDAILNEWEANPAYKDLRWLAYMLATAYHETGKAMLPVEEIGRGHGRIYGGKVKKDGTTYALPNKIYYGRGLVQITWYENYLTFSKRLNADFLNEPELTLTMKYSIKIMFLGMTQGLFTGVNLARYFDDKKEDWTNARKIINGKDKAELIALYGQRFYECLKP